MGHDAGSPGPRPMIGTRLSIRLDLPTGDRIGPGKIALLEAIRLEGSISAAARHLGMSYRRAWLLVEELNDALHHPVVAARSGGGGGAVVTPLGQQVIELYRTIEDRVHTSAGQEFRAVSKLVRRRRRAGD
jgi:molybdate transport system regulatory protein